MAQSNGISQQKTEEEVSWLAAIVETSRDPIFSITQQGIIASWNQAAESNFGYRAAEVIGQPFELLLPLHKQDEAAEILEKVLKGERIRPREIVWKRKDGMIVPVTLTASPIMGGSGEVCGVAFISQERIHLKQSEAAQSESKMVQQTLLDNLLTGVIIVDPQTHLIEKVNPATSVLFGAPVEQIEGRKCHQFLCPAQEGACPITDLGQVVDNSDRQLICADGTRIPILKSVKRIWVGDREKLLESFVNISGHKKAEEALKESEVKFRALVEQNSEGVVLIDERGCVIEWNSAKVQITGIPAEQAIGSYYWDLQMRLSFRERKTSEDCESFKTCIQQALQSGQSPLFNRPMDALIQRTDGQTVFIEETIFPIKTSLGYRIGSITRDVSERARSMQAVRESEELFRTSFENATAGVALVGLDKKFIQLNGKLAEIYGYTREELQHMIFSDLTHPEDLQIGKKALMQMLSGEIDRTTFEKRYIHKNGKTIWANISTGIVRKETGEPLYFIAYIQDITGSKLVQQELERRLKEMEVLYAVATAGSEVTSQSELFERATAAGQSLYPRDFGIGQVDESARIVQFPFYIKRDGGRAPDMAFGRGVTGRVAMTGLPIRLDDVTTDAEYIAADPACRSELCIPILVGERVMGVINVESDRAAAFGEADERILYTFAGELGTALEKIRLFKKTEQQLDHLTALRNIDQSILSSLDLNDTLKVVLEKITSLLKSEAANILLYDPRLSQVRVAATCGLSEAPAYQAAIHLDDPFSRQMFLEGKPQFIADLKLIREHVPAAYWEEIQQFSSAVFTPLIAKGEIQGVLQLYQRTPLEPARDWMGFLEALAGQAAIAIDNAQLFSEQQETNRRLIEAYDDTLDGWSRAMDLRDHETEGHSQRVADLTLQLAKRLDVSEKQLAHLHHGAKLHDIGKMGIPDNILTKPGKLTEEEWAVMRLHPVYAVNFLSRIKYLQPALEIPYCHHEKWDGSGYPQGLRGEDIPLFARIFAIVDVYDALTSDRPYRPAWSKSQALEYIREKSGEYFDPRLVTEFLALMQWEARKLERAIPSDVLW